MATKIIRKTKNSIVSEQTNSLPHLRSLRTVSAAPESPRQSYFLTVSADGTINTGTLRLGNRGDQNVTSITFDLTNLLSDDLSGVSLYNSEWADRFNRTYNAGLWIYNPKRRRSSSNPRLVVLENGVTSNGTVTYNVNFGDLTNRGADYELLFSILEKTPEQGNTERIEQFVSSVFNGKVVDTNIPTDFLSAIESAELIIDTDKNSDIFYEGFIRKPAINISLNKNKNLVVSKHKQVKKKDRYTTYLQIEADSAVVEDNVYNFSSELTKFYLIGAKPSVVVEEINDELVNTTVFNTVAYEFTQRNTTYRTWLPEYLTDTSEQFSLWIVGTNEDASKVFVSEEIKFKCGDNFLDNDWEYEGDDEESLYVLYEESGMLEASGTQVYYEGDTVVLNDVSYDDDFIVINNVTIK